MCDETYNGWSNWETWNANLWLTNDQGTVGIVNEAIGGETTPWKAGEAIRDMVEELLADGIRLIGDELTMWRVDWTEIAEAWLEE